MERIQAQISAAVMAHQIPSIPIRTGSSSTDAVWKISVRMKDMAAETAPLLSAVKSEDIKILKPANRKENENSLNAWLVSANSSAS